MNSYVTRGHPGMGGVVISDYAGLVGPLAQSVALGIVDLWYGKRVPDWVFKDAVASDQMKTISTSLSGLETRFKSFLKPYLPDDRWWLPTAWFKSLGYSLSLAITGGTAKGVYLQLKAFEKELSDIGDQWAKVTGQPKPESTKIKEIEPEKGWLGKLTDLTTTLALYGILGITVWYGGKLAYQYLDQKTRIPQNRLPRYAGGRRKSRR